MRLLILMPFILFGCVAKQSAVEENQKAITDIIAKMKKYHSEDQDLQVMVDSAIAREIKGAGLVDKETFDKTVNAVASKAGGFLGIPPGITEGLLGLFGIGGAGLVVAERKKRMRERQIYGQLDPQTADKIKDI